MALFWVPTPRNVSYLPFPEPHSFSGQDDLQRVIPNFPLGGYHGTESFVHFRATNLKTGILLKVNRLNSLCKGQLKLWLFKTALTRKRVSLLWCHHQATLKYVVPACSTQSLTLPKSTTRKTQNHVAYQLPCVTLLSWTMCSAWHTPLYHVYKEKMNVADYIKWILTRKKPVQSLSSCTNANW